MTVPLRLAQEEGIKAIVYLDDWLVWAESEAECSKHVLRVKLILENLGFLINQEKSQMDPVQRITWLGVEWDSR